MITPQSETRKIALNYSPRDWQRIVHTERLRFTVLALHRRAGKTELAIMELIDKAMRCTLDEPYFIYLAPFLKQAKAICWGRIKMRVEPLLRVGAVSVHEGIETIRFTHNGAQIRIFGADNPDAMRGLRLDGVVIDEVAWIKPSVWEDILQPALADRLGWALFIGTPWGVNLFSQLYQLAERTEGWHAKTWTVYETGAIDDAEVKRLRETMTEAAFAREMLCDFAAAGDDQLISLADVITAAERTYTLRDIELAPVVLGVDPARFGDDRSVIVRRQGLNMFPPEIYNGIDNMALASRVAAAIVEYRPKAVFIDSGAGAGVIDRLRQLGHGVVEVPFGGKANKLAEFVNRRTEMWWTMKEWLELGGAIPDEPDLKQELATPTYSYDPAGRKKLESKEDIKKRLQGGSSPDIADGLALTFAYPVSQRVPKTRAQRRQESAYDPYAKL